MMKVCKNIMLFGLLAIVNACATAKDYDKYLNSFLGESQNQIEQKFGNPSAIKIVDDNTKVLAYTQVDDVFVPSEFYDYQQGEEFYGQDGIFSPFLNTYLFSDNPGDLGYEVEYICKTMFLLQNDKVTAWKWQGNNCVAPGI